LSHLSSDWATSPLNWATSPLKATSPLGKMPNLCGATLKKESRCHWRPYTMRIGKCLRALKL
jgi:hypothetical protein